MAEMARRSNFAVACGLLSRYIKEKGSIAELGLGMATRPPEDPKGKSEAIRQPTTMTLLPGANISSVKDGERVTEGEDAENAMEFFPQIPREQENTQLTIFYRGSVFVFDNFPAEKANDLMQLARDGNLIAHNVVHISPALTVPVSTSKVSLAQNTTLASLAVNPPLAPQDIPSRTAQPSLPDLPVARKVSLQRFLKRRKDQQLMLA